MTRQGVRSYSKQEKTKLERRGVRSNLRTCELRACTTATAGCSPAEYGDTGMDIRSTGSACSPAERCDFMGTLAVPQAKRDPTVRSGSTAGDASDSDVSCHQADSR